MSLKYAVIWPLARLKSARWVSLLTICSVLVASFVVVSLTSFVEQVDEAVEEELDGLGYDFLITARGCPYEAATLMLRGGVGMRYMPESAVARIQNDPDISASFPILIHPVRDPASDEGMLLLRGVAVEAFEANGHRFSEGTAFSSQEVGVVLGYEAAELEQRSAGDFFLLPGSLDQPAKEVPVLGILERSGTQLDGSIMLPIALIQQHYALQEKLTGVGVQVHSNAPGQIDALIDRYESDPGLQVVQLSAVATRLRGATSEMATLAAFLSAVVSAMALLLWLAVALMRSATDQQQVHALHAAGISTSFLMLCTALETGMLLLIGVLLGFALVPLVGLHFVGFFEQALPYVPDHLALSGSPSLLLRAAGLVLIVSVLAAILQGWRLHRTSVLDLRRSV